ncbi:MAG: hypothetical protein JSU72_18515 [Deltaproteobacteria bacterium]|nr:MAG: hypothetical protein JSU72_18515 [Deltaproteobacteria bacterium]
MIKLTRERYARAIPSGLRGRSRVEKNLKVLKLKREEGSIPSKSFKSTFWKAAKQQLRKESNDKCAYCEADTSIVAHGDVEHFRPKNVYWWLAYCYDNYLYSCQICNQRFKSNHFPISGTKLSGPLVRSNSTDERLAALAKEMTPDPLDTENPPGLNSFIQAAIDEDADLIDPYMVDPEPLLVYEVDDDLREVKVKIAPRSLHRAARQEAIDKVYGLNREELRKVRYQDYEMLEMLRQVLVRLDDDDKSVDEVKTALRAMLADNHRFAGMSRYFIKKKWKLDVTSNEL